MLFPAPKGITFSGKRLRTHTIRFIRCRRQWRIPAAPYSLRPHLGRQVVSEKRGKSSHRDCLIGTVNVQVHSFKTTQNKSKNGLDVIQSRDAWCYRSQGHQAGVNCSPSLFQTAIDDRQMHSNSYSFQPEHNYKHKHIGNGFE